MAIVLVYLCFALAVGVLSRRQASRSTVAFFAAGRSLPGWVLGVSMVATTFAVDTPLAITGIVAGEGIAGNWFWWCTAIGHVGMIVLFSRLWRRGGVITDAELAELRYGGRSAAVLRAVQAFFYSLLVNSFVLGWGLVAALKVADAMTPWPAWWTVGALMTFALGYAALGGLRAVVLTDLAQFAFAMVGATALAVFAVREVGGLAVLAEQVQRAEAAPTGVLDIVPRFGTDGVLAATFATYLLMQWWARLWSDGGGYLAQRMLASKDPENARTAATWFVWLHYVVRPWPWILVALAALILVPAGSALLPDGDREAAYPLLMMRLMPPGLLGVALASLIAAFMSTVDTHLNWGSSYLVNDLYGRLLRPQAGRRELLAASWAGMLLVALLAVGVASVFDSVVGAWKAFALGGAGLGLPTLLRWVWWRITAWCELAGMGAGLVAAVLLSVAAPDMLYAHKLWIVVAISAAAAVLALVAGPPPDAAACQRFVSRVHPPGFWGPHGDSVTGGLAMLLAAWGLGVAGVFGVLIGTGQSLLGRAGTGLPLMALGAAAWWGCRTLIRRGDRMEETQRAD